MPANHVAQGLLLSFRVMVALDKLTVIIGSGFTNFIVMLPRLIFMQRKKKARFTPESIDCTAPSALPYASKSPGKGYILLG